MNAYTFSYSTNSCYMCIRERQSHLTLNSPPKNSHCQNSACGVYINIPSYARRCSVKTSARSSQPASLPLSGPVNITFISLLAQDHVLSLLFLHSSPVCRQSSFINNSTYLSLIIYQVDCAKCLYFIKYGCYNNFLR